MPVRLTPLERPATDAIVVGDSRRAFALAQALTVQPRMSHQARGLWGYTGTSESGHDLTVQSTGVGGPSAVAVISGLIEIGSRRIIRLGTCVSTSDRFDPGAAVLVERAIAADGAGRALIGEGEPPAPSTHSFASAEPDPGLFEALTGLAEPATVSSHDLIARLDPGPEPGAGRPRGEAPVRDLQTAATLALATRLGASAAAILIVAEAGNGDRLGEAQLEERFLEIAPDTLKALERTSPD